MNVNQQLIRDISIGLAAGTITSIGSYFIIKEHFRKAAEEEVESLRTYYKSLRKVDEYETPEKAFEHLHKLEETKQEIVEEQEKFQEIVEQSNYQPTPEDLEDNGMTGDNRPERVPGATVGRYVVPSEETITPADEDDLPILQEPDDDKPYLIRQDQFGEEYDKHTKSSIVYYGGDQKLMDEADDEIPNVDRIVGLYSLSQFGTGKYEDEDQIYVRNHRIKTDYEILLDPRTSTEALYGVDPQHIGMVERFGDHG